MYDLIYFGDRSDYLEAKNDLIKTFPGARIEDASDIIHEFRLSIRINNIELEDYRIKLLNIQLALCSLNFSLFMAENNADCKKLIDKWKKQYNER